MDTASAVAVDAADDIFVVGGFYGTANFGGAGPLTATSGSDVYIVKYTLAGAYLWARSFGGTGSEVATAAAVNGLGDVVIVGTFCGTISFGGPPMSSTSACSFTDAFAARLTTPDGSYVNSVRAGGTGSEVGSGVSLSSDGRFYVTGDFNGFAEFGGHALTPLGIADSYILGLAPL